MANLANALLNPVRGIGAEVGGPSPGTEAMEDRCLASIGVGGPVFSYELGVGMHSHHAQGSPPQFRTGVSGVAMVGPITPVQRPGVPNTRPLVDALIEVRRATGGPIVAEVRTEAHGRFVIPLRPGKYELIPRPPHVGDFFPRGEQQSVTVPPHGFARLVVNYDSGIR